MLAATITAGLLTGLIAGLVPAVRASRPSAGDSLRASGVAAGVHGGWRHGSSGIFLVAQIALSLMLLTCTGLLLRSLGSTVTAISEGLDTSAVTIARLSLPASYARERLVPFASQLAEEARARTGGRGAAVSIGLPHDAMMLGTVQAGGAPPGVPPVRVATLPVTPDYFSVYGIQLRDGALLTEGSPLDSAVISEAAARALFDGNAIGGQIVSGQLRRTVTGVVSDVPGIGYGSGDKVIARPQEHVCIPFAAAPSRYYFTLSVSYAPRGPSPAALREIVRQTDPHIAINDVYSLQEHVERKFAQAQLYLRLLAALAVIALTIAAAGIYAVLAYAVAQRTPELGLRMALGARPRQIFVTVASRAMALTVIGSVAGGGLAFAASHAIRAAIFDVSPADPLVLGAAIAAVMLIAGVAAAVPASRTLRVNPAEVLRGT